MKRGFIPKDDQICWSSWPQFRSAWKYDNIIEFPVKLTSWGGHSPFATHQDVMLLVYLGQRWIYIYIVSMFINKLLVSSLYIFIHIYIYTFIAQTSALFQVRSSQTTVQWWFYGIIFPKSPWYVLSMYIYIYKYIYMCYVCIYIYI